MTNILITLRKFIAARFSLHEDSAHDAEIIESISRNVEFKGANLWSLIFAIQQKPIRQFCLLGIQ